MALPPELDLVGSPTPVRASASDVAHNSECGLFLNLKVRPQVKKVNGWSRIFADRNKDPFPLREIREIVAASHKEGLNEYSEVQAWISGQLELRKTHRLLRPYISHAVESLLDAHDFIEQEIGPLTLLASDPEIGTRDRKVWTWGLLYETQDGTREIRRLRIGSVHDDPNEDDNRWAATAAFVASRYRSRHRATRVRVVEISLFDGNFIVLFDGTPEQADELYAKLARPRIQKILDLQDATPCRSCSECKTVGTCPSLAIADGTLGQSEHGFKSRSISPSQLEQYNRCPAQWFLASSMHLPKKKEVGDAALRGMAVHHWLANAHKRGIPCTLDDLPVPTEDKVNYSEVLTDEQYSEAYPYLLQHLDRCPLDGTCEVTCVETDLYGYDHNAEVVVATRPDIVYKTNDVLRIRETKTAASAHINDRNEAYDKHFQVPFLLTFASNGLMQNFGSQVAVIELEILTPTEQQIWSWSTEEAMLAMVAAGDVRRAASAWHVDETWSSTPGLHCSWCPVSEWCPDRGRNEDELSDKANESLVDGDSEIAPF